jgi:hypothetical protein
MMGVNENSASEKQNVNHNHNHNTQTDPIHTHKTNNVSLPNFGDLAANLTVVQ